ncbi:MAG: hypothetical protein M3R08_08980, partial [Bacteroidota bacterium]|nr:hypothetical protein [Bacteroidota bacterium]
LLAKAGFKEVLTLAGGYKAFRNQVLSEFDLPLELNVLGGYTGTGKSELLRMLQDQKEQIIDLELLACHKGSSFGALGQPAQPSTEYFENLLWQCMRELDRSKPVWIEDESPMIGRVRIPDSLFKQMRQAPLFFMEMPIEQRALRLVEEYGVHPIEELSAAIDRIAKRVGPQHAKEAKEALQENDLLTVVLIVLRYYDKAYLRGSMERNEKKTKRIPLNNNEMHLHVDRLREHVTSNI